MQLQALPHAATAYHPGIKWNQSAKGNHQLLHLTFRRSASGAEDVLI
jgi:hypothetical protein